MAALSLSIDAIKPLNRWDYSSIRPGSVGSVGDCLITERLKSSLPGDFRWDPNTFGNNESDYGSSVQDGSKQSFNSGGGPARTLDTNWGGRRRFETSHGWRYQDLRVPDKRIEPVLGAMPQYSWHNRIATVNNARTTGNLFTVPRGGVLEGPSGVTRGGNFPLVTAVVGGDETAGFQSGTINTGPPLTAPNFHPHLSTFGGGARNEENERHSFSRGPPGKIRR